MSGFISRADTSPSIFTEGDYRRVRLTHPTDWLNIATGVNRTCASGYVCGSERKGPEAFICPGPRRETSIHVEKHEDRCLRVANGAKLKGDATIKRETAEFIAAVRITEHRRGENG